MTTSKHSPARGARRGASYVAWVTSWHTGPESRTVDRCVVEMWDIVGASAIVGASYPASDYPKHCDDCDCASCEAAIAEASLRSIQPDPRHCVR